MNSKTIHQRVRAISLRNKKTAGDKLLLFCYFIFLLFALIIYLL